MTPKMLLPHILLIIFVNVGIVLNTKLLHTLYSLLVSKADFWVSFPNRQILTLGIVGGVCRRPKAPVFDKLGMWLEVQLF